MIKNHINKVLLIIILCGNILIPGCNYPDSTNQKGNLPDPDPSSTPTKQPTPTKTPAPNLPSTDSHLPYLGDFHITMNGKTDDPNDVPAELIWLMNVERIITIKDDPFRIEFPYPWVSVSGELNPDGSITATGSGSIDDGNPFTSGTFEGYITPDLIEGVYILKLPGEQPVVFRVKGARNKQEASPTPTSTPTPEPDDSEQGCMIFEEVEIVDTIMRHMRDCRPTLNFYYKMDTSVPGLGTGSTMDLDYWVMVNGKEGDCFLESGFDDRLYCRVDISLGEANTLGHFELFANSCQDPISDLDLSIPELEGCGEPQTDSEEPPCDSED